MRRLLRLRIILGVFIVSILMSIFCLPDTYATIKSSDSLYKLSILQGAKDCYRYATNSISDVDFENGGWSSIFSNNGDYSKDKDGAWITTHVGNNLNSSAWITTHVGNNLNSSRESDSNLSCKEIFEGYSGKAKGLTSYFDMPTTLAGMGYEATGNVSDEDGISLKIISVTDRTGNSAEKVTIDGNEIFCYIDKTSNNGKWKISKCNGKISIRKGTEEFKLVFNGGIKPQEASNVDKPYGVTNEGQVWSWLKNVEGSSADSFKSSFKSEFMDQVIKHIGYKAYGVNNTSTLAEIDFTSVSETTYKPIDNDKNKAAGAMLYNLGVDSNFVSIVTTYSKYPVVSYAWNDDWRYALYYLYLMDMMRQYPNDIKIGSCGEEKPTSNWAFKNTPSMWCAISVSDSFASKLDNGELVVSVPDGSFSMRKGNFEEALTWLRQDKSYTLMSDDAYAETKVNDDGTISSYAQEGVDYSDECYNNSGSLSWIICPIVEGASGIGGYMWERVENYHLKIPAQEVFESGGGVEQAWKIVRDIANIVFIILLLFVIFSQLTGVGIDNYGIKKIMPKLILVAVLVNLSYIICQLAVDLSNILGVGLNSLLSGFAESGFTNLNTGGTGSTVAGWSMTGLLGGGGLALYGVLAGGTTLPLAGAAIGLMVLGVVITVVVALLTLYLILIIREAGIILAIVVAPVAIVCYMLPNTEKLYKKWFNIFKALLLVYPICGALVGAGQLAGVTLASIDSGSMRVAAMIVQVLPFFFIPMLLKSSMALMGNLGAKISTFGRSLGSRGSSIAKSTIRNTEGFKEMSQFGKDASILRRAQRIHNRYSGRKNLSEREALRLGKADAALLGREEAVNRGKLMADGGYTARVIAQEKEVDAKAIEDAMVKIKADTNDGADEKAVQTVFNDAMSRGDRITARAALRVAGRRKDTAAAFMQETLMNGDKTYDKTMLASVAKEISEGQTSANYRAASSLGFEFASQLNKGDTDLSYKDWIADQKNIHNALDHHIATSGQLMGSQNSSLEEIADLASTGGMGEYDVDRVRSLAQEAIRFNKEKGVEFDTTKAFNAYRLAYGDEAFLSRMREDGVQIDPKKLEEFRAKRQSGALPNRPFKVRPTRQ